MRTSRVAPEPQSVGTVTGPTSGDIPATAKVRPGDRSTVAVGLTIAVVMFLAVAIVKPWGPATRTASEATDAPPVATTIPISSAVPQPSALVALAGTSCLSSDRQQLIVFERWPGNEVRSWIAVPDLAGTGPLDRTLVSTDVFAAHAVAIGVCAGTAATSLSDRHAASIVDVRFAPADARGGQAVDAGAPRELPRTTGPDPVRLFAPPPLAVASASASLASATAAGGASAPPGSMVGSAGSAPSGGSPRAGSPAGGSAAAVSSPSAGSDTQTWALGAYTIAFRFEFDPPSTERWLRFALLRGGGDG